MSIMFASHTTSNDQKVLVIITHNNYSVVRYGGDWTCHYNLSTDILSETQNVVSVRYIIIFMLG